MLYWEHDFFYVLGYMEGLSIVVRPQSSLLYARLLGYVHTFQKRYTVRLWVTNMGYGHENEKKKKHR
jgi:hypothetical protein